MDLVLFGRSISLSCILPRIAAQNVVLLTIKEKGGAVANFDKQLLLLKGFPFFSLAMDYGYIFVASHHWLKAGKVETTSKFCTKKQK